MYKKGFTSQRHSMVVQKFGGTSVADPEAIRRLIEIVRTARARDGAGPAVVVSAMSGVTDGLLRLAADAAAGRTADAHAGVAKIRERHLAAAADLAPWQRRPGDAPHRDLSAARRRGDHARHAARDHAAHVGRRCRHRRAAQLAAGRGGPDPRRVAGQVGRRQARGGHDRRSHAGDAADQRDKRGAARHASGRQSRSAACR